MRAAAFGKRAVCWAELTLSNRDAKRAKVMQQTARPYLETSLSSELND